VLGLQEDVLAWSTIGALLVFGALLPLFTFGAAAAGVFVGLQPFVTPVNAAGLPVDVTAFAIVSLGTFAALTLVGGLAAGGLGGLAAGTTAALVE
jgi:fatty acid desaturase